MTFLKKLRSLPLLFSFVGGTPSGSLMFPQTTPIMIRFENARIVTSTSGCTFNSKTEGISTCTRNSAGKAVLAFSPAWQTAAPNCTISPESETNVNVWALPTTSQVSVGAFDYTLNLGVLGKTYGDGAYAIRCSGTQ